MTDAERALWTVVAQILPVLGLALILEARALAQAHQQYRSTRSPRSVAAPRTQVAMLGLSGPPLALGFLVAIWALQHDTAPGPAIEALIYSFIVFAVSILLVTPAMNVVLSGRWVWRVGRFLHRQNQRQLLRTVAGLQRSTASARALTFDLLSRAENTLSEFRRQLDQADLDRESIESYRAAASDCEEIVRTQSAAYRSLVVEELNLLRYRRELRRRLKERNADYIGTELRIDPTTGLISLALGSDYCLPDDGGFLCDPPELPRPPNFGDSRPRLITDPADFYRDR